MSDELEALKAKQLELFETHYQVLDYEGKPSMICGGMSCDWISDSTSYFPEDQRKEFATHLQALLGDIQGQIVRLQVGEAFKAFALEMTTKEWTPEQLPGGTVAAALAYDRGTK